MTTQPVVTSRRASPAWQALADRAAQTPHVPINSLFRNNPQRFDQCSLQAAGLFLDYSKNPLDQSELKLLFDLARERGVSQATRAMFDGEAINTTEQRAVLHTALRSSRKSLLVDGENIIPKIANLQSKMADFVDEVRTGRWTGATGKAITDVVNVGIGGSDLGPKMVVEALADPADISNLRGHFVSNVDGENLRRVVARLDAETTLFVVTSKTFSTAETLLNARSARHWLTSKLGSDAGLERHFVAVSTNAQAVADFGIAEQNRFEMWDWVGGRYSLWSAVGLSIALACGMGVFRELLKGASAMDEHFQTAPLASNMPVILAMIGIWNRNFLDIPCQLILPYDERLASFPAYLQQCDMESNGKSVTKDGGPVGASSGPVVWGSAGTNAQHAYMQLLHQGTEPVAADFIVALQPRTGSELAHHHPVLVANCFAQSEALMRGRSESRVLDELTSAGMSQADAERLAPHQVHVGNRPNNMLLMEQLTPQSLGALIALYEHKVFVQGVIWGINSFDQWGVELGKQLAGRLLGQMDGESIPAADTDGSTAGLLRRYRALNPR